MQEDQKSKVAYRLESEKSFQINADHSDVRNRARQLLVLRNCLFGRKRYQNILLNSSLNNFFNALRIAQVLNSKVPDLAMIIRFVDFVIVEVYDNNESKEIKRKRIEIKLTTKPSEEDKAQPGFNPGTPKEKITDPIQNIVPRREPRAGFNKPRRDNDRQHRNPQRNDRYDERSNRDSTRDNKISNRGRKEDRERDTRENRNNNKTKERTNNRGNDRPPNQRGKQYEQIQDDEDYNRHSKQNGKKSRAGSHGTYDRQAEQNRYHPSHIKN